jgi:hypothetical protein
MMCWPYVLAKRLARQGLGFLSPTEGVAVLETLLRGLSLASPATRPVCVSRTDWAVYALAMPRCRGGAAAFLDQIIPLPKVDQPVAPPLGVDQSEAWTPAALPPMQSLADVLLQVRACVAALAGADVLPDAPLMDAGLDSLTAVEARNELSNAFGGALHTSR